MSPFKLPEVIADWFTHTLLHLDSGTRLAESVNFYIYDSIKIIALLVAINYLMAVVRYYLPIEKMRAFLQSRKFYGLDYLLGASFGALTPFCSCSSVPLFVGFLGAGIPVGVTFSFLITSPLINQAGVALFIGLFGLKITAIYVAAGILVGVVGGAVMGRLDVRKHISRDILEMSKQVKTSDQYLTASKRAITRALVNEWWGEGFALTKKLIPYVLVGVGIGALIHGYVPQSFFESTLSTQSWWAVPLAAIMAVPLYTNVVGVVPIMQALVAKGVMLGTAMAFMMATVGLSMPEAMILKKVMSVKLLTIYFSVVTVGIIFIGYTINILW